MSVSSGVDAQLRKSIFDHCRAQGCPPSVEALMNEFRLDRSAIEAALDRLDEAHHLKLVPGTHRVLMAFPFSAIATPYEVWVDGQTRYFANCAWDALAFYPMLRSAIEIRSYCFHCGQPVRFQVRDGPSVAASRPPPVVYLGLRAAEWWKNIVTTCANTMVFFATSEHLAQWRAEHPDASGAEVSLETMLRLSEPLYATKLSLDYARPSRDRMMATFRELGLVGEFWTI